MTHEEFYEKIYRLAYIVRYSNVPRVKDESVAEHSFFVAAITMKLHEKYEFDIGKALQIAVAHDIPESETNDISWAIKQRYPAIRNMLDIAEKELAMRMPKTVQEGILGFAGDSVEAMFVKMADAMQCHQYAIHEVSLGNQGYMLSVLAGSAERVRVFEEELSQYER